MYTYYTALNEVEDICAPNRHGRFLAVMLECHTDTINENYLYWFSGRELCNASPALPRDIASRELKFKNIQRNGGKKVQFLS